MTNELSTSRRGLLRRGATVTGVAAAAAATGVPAYRALLTSDLYRAGGSKPPAGAPDTDCREEAGR